MHASWGRVSDDTRGAVVTAIGPPKSGKSTLLWDCYTSREPRVLSVDVVGWAQKRDRLARATFGLEQTLAALRDVAPLPKWHVAASLERDELEELCWVLCPHRTSERTIGFGKAVGGMTLFCDELLQLAPNGLKSSRVKVAYLQHRHHWLSIHGATQHAPDCDPCTRSGDRVIALRTQDDLSLAAIARATSKAVAALVAELPEFHSVTCVRSVGRAYIADQDYHVYHVIDYRGATEWRRESAGALAGVPSSASGHGTVPRAAKTATSRVG